MVAGMLHKMGVHMGDNMLGKDWSNPLGHFEDRRIVVLNDQILHENNMGWMTRRRPKNCSRENLELIREYLQRRMEKRYWGLKDPRLVSTYEWWAEALDLLGVSTVVFLVWRSPLHIARSLMKRNHFQRGVALDIALKNQKWMGRIPGVDFSYDEILKKPGKEIKRMASHIGLDLTDEARKKALSVVHPELNRSAIV
jgi:hypothetical protein